MIVAIINDCKINGKPSDGFWKFVDVPALPPVGSWIWMRNDDGVMDIGGTVEKLEWWEGCACYEVFLKMPFDSFEGDELEIMKEFESAGWKSESKSPLCESNPRTITSR